MQVQIKKWGNSQGIRISKEVLKEAQMSLDETVEIAVVNGRIEIQKAFRHRTLEERAAAYEGHLHLDRELDWGEYKGREVW